MVRHIAYILFAMMPLQADATDVFKCTSKGSVEYGSTSKCAGKARRIIISRQDVNVSSGVRFDGSRMYVDVALHGQKLPPFVLDTGATMTAIPADVAARIGIECKEDALVNTANGAARGCFAKMSNVEISGRKFREIDVVVLPLLKQPLLGMTEITKMRNIDRWMN